MTTWRMPKRTATTRAIAALAVLTVLAGTAAAQTVSTETIDFKKPDRDATKIARAMYGQKYPWVSAERFWLIKPEEGQNDQIAVQLGQKADCASECEVMILYHTDNGWANIWRESGKTFGLGTVNEMTGLKSVVHANRTWDWDGKNYYPMPVGDVPKYRPASEAEMSLAVGWIKDHLDLPDTVEPPTISVVEMDLKSGDEKALMLQGTPFCGNSECPVLIVDGDRILTNVMSIGPDVRQGTGLRDTDGYRMIEVSRPLVTDVVSPGSGQVAFDLGPEPVVRAGTE